MLLYIYMYFHTKVFLTWTSPPRRDPSQDAPSHVTETESEYVKTIHAGSDKHVRKKCDLTLTLVLLFLVLEARRS